MKQDKLDRLIRNISKLTPSWMNSRKNQNLYKVINNSPVGKILKNMPNNVYLNNLQCYFRYLDSPFIKQLDFTNKCVSQNIKDRIAILLGKGWYIDKSMPIIDLREIASLFEQDNIELAESILLKHFKNNFKKIRNDILTTFEHRKIPIEQALDAHNNGLYYLSIPVFFAQVDGISKEITNYGFFEKHNGKPKTKHIYDDCSDSQSIIKAFLSPLAETTVYNISEKDRDETFSGLNRHMVLHGESVDYGTEINSYKALSILLYLTRVVFSFCQEHKY